MIEYEVKKFIKEYWNCNIDKLNLNTRLDDIGMYGDDKYDFIIDFSKNFKLKIDEDFSFKDYIDDESDYLGIGYIFEKIFLKEKKKKIKTINISKLIEWINLGYIK